MVQDNLIEKILLELAQIKQENTELKAEIKRLNSIINKDSSNSSKPPSTNNGFADPKKSSSESTTKKKKKPRGGQIGSKGTNLKKVNNPDHIEILEVNSCKNCNHNLEDISSKLISTKQVFDVPPLNIEVTEYQLHSKTCSCSIPSPKKQRIRMG